VQRDVETTRHPDLAVRDGLTPMQVDQLLQLYRGEWWSRRRSAADVRRILEGSNAVVAVVETDTGALAAFARVLTDGVYLALILDVIVAPRHRERGVGRLLMDSVLGLPALRHVVSVELVCQPELVPFYAKWGFSGEIGRSRLLRRTADPALRGDGGRRGEVEAE
jgi:GNAT superfamily N-acetyltransferase